MNARDFIKRFWLKYVVGYSDPQSYWDSRWRMRVKSENRIARNSVRALELKDQIFQLMKKYSCSNILEIGCGRAILRDLPNYLGMDFSLNALEQSRLRQFLYADLTRRIPLPSKSMDMILSHFVLLHIPPNGIERAVSEMMRVAKNVIVLREPTTKGGRGEQSQPHCFRHDLEEMFKNFSNVVFF